MSLKLKFAEAASVPGANISALCAQYGISRQTGHKWLRRYRAQGYLGLVELSRRPSSSPETTSEEVVRAVLEVRNRHASWGAHKIARVLVRTLGPEAPAKSTVQRLLRRFGKIRARRPAVRVWTVEGKPRVEVTKPNDLWTIDFKGWWKARNGERCEPLTVRDAFSRFSETVSDRFVARMADAATREEAVAAIVALLVLQVRFLPLYVLLGVLQLVPRFRRRHRLQPRRPVRRQPLSNLLDDRRAARDVNAVVENRIAEQHDMRALSHELVTRRVTGGDFHEGSRLRFRATSVPPAAIRR